MLTSRRSPQGLPDDVIHIVVSALGRDMPRFLHNWCAQAMESGIVQMMSLAKTIRSHATGKLEGINNKIACLKRAAYGYRDHEFFTLKLYSLHESSLRLSPALSASRSRR